MVYSALPNSAAIHLLRFLLRDAASSDTSRGRGRGGGGRFPPFFLFFAACSRLAQVISPGPAVCLTPEAAQVCWQVDLCRWARAHRGNHLHLPPQIKAVVVQKKRSKRSRSGWGASLRPPVSLQRKCLISSCPLERARLCKTWTDEVCYYYSPTLFGLNKRCRKRKTVKLIHVNFNDFVTDFFLHFFRFFHKLPLLFRLRNKTWPKNELQTV